MYDRQTESLWSQLEGKSIAGVLAGTGLQTVPVSQLPWSTWRQENPDGWVLSRDTGHDRPYGQNPYVGYDEAESDPFLLDERADDRLPPKERVVAFPAASESVAIRLVDVADSGVVSLSLDGDPVVVFAQPGLASALDARDISDGRQIDATAVFSAELDGQVLSFRRAGEAFVDAGGTTWDLFGRGTAGPLQGRSLEPVTHVDTFWFAWAAFRPDTTIWEQ